MPDINPNFAPHTAGGRKADRNEINKQKRKVMKTMTFNRKIENGNVFYCLDGEEIARSFIVPSNKILNPKRLPEYRVRFSPESDAIYGKFVKLDSIISYIDSKIYQHFGNMGIYCKITD